MSESSKQARLRAERQAKALRSNLNRRKLQARRRDAAASEDKHAGGKHAKCASDTAEQPEEAKE